MSLQVMAWAMQYQDLPIDQKTGRFRPTSKLVLLALADRASPEGTDCFPSVPAIQEYTGLSERMIQYDLRAMESHGTIVKTPNPLKRAQTISNADRWPQSYDIVAYPGYRVQDRIDGVQDRTERGARSRQDQPSEVCDLAPEPVLQTQPLTTEPKSKEEPTPPYPPADAGRSAGKVDASATVTEETLPGMQPPASETEIKPSSGAEIDAAFERWWKIYPRRTEKPKARKAFVKVIKEGRADPDTLTAEARRYAGVVAGSRYIKYPATWLNNDCWDDELVPPSDVDPTSNGHQPYQNPPASAYVRTRPRHEQQPSNDAAYVRIKPRHEQRDSLDDSVYYRNGVAR